MIKYTPFGNTILKDFAISAIENEKLGQTPDVTDLIASSFSAGGFHFLYSPQQQAFMLPQRHQSLTDYLENGDIHS